MWGSSFTSSNYYARNRGYRRPANAQRIRHQFNRGGRASQISKQQPQKIHPRNQPRNPEQVRKRLLLLNQRAALQRAVVPLPSSTKNRLYKLVRVSTPASGSTVGTSNISTRNINVNISNIATSNPIRPTNSQQQQPMVNNNNNNSSNNITSPTAATTVKKLLLYSFLIKTELIEAYWTKNNATEMLMEKYE